MIKMYMIDRRKLKIHAQEIIRSSNPKVINVGLVYLLISIVLGVLSARVIGSNITQTDILQMTKHMQSGNVDYAMQYMQRFIPEPSAYAVDFLLNTVMYVVSVGFTIFLLNTIRNTAPCFGNLLDGFGIILRVILLSLLEGLFIMLWSLLFVVPGIIAAYRYRQALYILIDNPDKSVMQCIRESKEMMRGRKWELFVLDLSFIGWQILSMFAVIGWAVQVWTVPYINMTYALYYEAVRNAYSGGYNG